MDYQKADTCSGSNGAMVALGEKIFLRYASAIRQHYGNDKSNGCSSGAARQTQSSPTCAGELENQLTAASVFELP